MRGVIHRRFSQCGSLGDAQHRQKGADFVHARERERVEEVALLQGKESVGRSLEVDLALPTGFDHLQTVKMVAKMVASHLSRKFDRRQRIFTAGGLTE